MLLIYALCFCTVLLVIDLDLRFNKSFLSWPQRSSSFNVREKKKRFGREDLRRGLKWIWSEAVLSWSEYRSKSSVHRERHRQKTSIHVRQKNFYWRHAEHCQLTEQNYVGVMYRDRFNKFSCFHIWSVLKIDFTMILIMNRAELLWDWGTGNQFYSDLRYLLQWFFSLSDKIIDWNWRLNHENWLEFFIFEFRVNKSTV